VNEFVCPSCGTTVWTAQEYSDALCANGHPAVELEPVSKELVQAKKDRLKRIAAEAKEQG